MSDELQIFIDADGEELIGGGDILDELWSATRQGVRAGSYMFGLDVLGATPMLNAEAKAPGSTNASPVAIANRLKSKGQLAVEAGQRAIASSRRYRAGKKLGQKAVEAGQRALNAGKKVKAAGDSAAKAAALRAAATQPTPKASTKAVSRAAPTSRVAQTAAVRATPRTAVVAPRVTVPTAARVTAPTGARMALPIAPTAVAPQRVATRLRGEAIGAESASPEALEAAAAAWADMATTVEKMNVAGEAAAQVADQADKLGVDATPVWDALMEAFSEEPYKQGFVVQWSNYAYGPEIAEGAAEARTAAAQWTAKVNPLVEQLKQQLAQAQGGDPAQQPATPSTDPYAAPGGFNPGTAGGGPFPDDGTDSGEGGGTSSETLQRFRESGGAWDPFEDAEFYVEEDGGEEMFDESTVDESMLDEEGALADEEESYDPEAAEMLLDEEDPFSAYAAQDSGVPGEFSAKRDARAAAIADTFETDEDAQAFVERRSLLEDGVLPVEDRLAGLDFQAQYIFLPHTAITDWQKEKDAQLAAGNEAALQAQISEAEQAAAAARAKQPGAKLNPVVAMRLAAARRQLKQARERLAQANAAADADATRTDDE